MKYKRIEIALKWISKRSFYFLSKVIRDTVFHIFPYLVNCEKAVTNNSTYYDNFKGPDIFHGRFDFSLILQRKNEE